MRLNGLGCEGVIGIFALLAAVCWIFFMGVSGLSALEGLHPTNQELGDATSYFVLGTIVTVIAFFWRVDTPKHDIPNIVFWPCLLIAVFLFIQLALLGVIR